jgi:monomeric isocitrate dehydrogenase
VYAWKATIFSVHHDSPDEAFKMLSEAHPTVFGSILLSGFTSFFKDFKDNLAQFKRSFQDAVQNLAKKNIEGDSVKEIKKDVSDLDDTDSDLDDTDFANAIDKLSHHDDPDLGDLGPTYLQGLRENAASKAPRKQVF